jgi:YcxB-like protein
MDISYTMTPDDLRRFSRYCMLHWPGTPLSLFLIPPGSLLLAGTLIQALAGSPWVVVSWWMALAALILGAVLVWMADAGVGPLARKTPGALGAVWLRITPAGVEERTPLTDELKMWVRVQKVASTRHAIYLFSAPSRAYVAPRRAFATPADAETFLALARSYWQAARERTGIAPGGPSPRDRDRAA